MGWLQLEYCCIVHCAPPSAAVAVEKRTLPARYLGLSALSRVAAHKTLFSSPLSPLCLTLLPKTDISETEGIIMAISIGHKEVTTEHKTLSLCLHSSNVAGVLCYHRRGGGGLGPICSPCCPPQCRVKTIVNIWLTLESFWREASEHG